MQGKMINTGITERRRKKHTHKTFNSTSMIF